MTRKFTSAVAGLILVILVAGPEARQQAPAFGSAVAVTPRDDAHAAAPRSVKLLVGRSTILDIGGTIARVSLTVPDIADAMVTAPTQLLIHGKQPGTISMFVWDRMGAIKTYEVVVRRDLSSLVEHVKQLFPGETISVAGSGKDVVLSGTVTEQVRHRQGRGRGRRLRREEGKRRQPAQAAGGCRVEPGDAARFASRKSAATRCRKSARRSSATARTTCSAARRRSSSRRRISTSISRARRWATRWCSAIT